MNCLDQIVDAVGWQQSGAARIASVGSHVDDSDAVVGVEHVDRVWCPQRDPAPQRAGVARVERVECQRGQREVVDQVDVSSDRKLVEVVAVHLDQDVHGTFVAHLGEATDEVHRLGQHEARSACAFDRVADSVEAHARDPSGCEAVEDALQVGPTEGMLDVDVDLLIGEGGPHHSAGAIVEVDHGEGRCRAGPIDRSDLLRRWSAAEDMLWGEEHRSSRRVVASRQPLAKRCGFRRNMVHDQIGHQVVSRCQVGDALPRADAGVHRGVVDGIESCVGAVDRHEERQQVHPTERPVELLVEQGADAVDVAGEAVGVRDQHRRGVVRV